MRRLISFFLVIAILAMFHNNIANRHFHVLPDGTVIEHAHPIKETPSVPAIPFEKHSHSDIEFLILDLLFYSGLAVVVAYLSVFINRQSAIPLQICIKEKFYPRRQYNLTLLRAPPQL